MRSRFYSVQGKPLSSRSCLGSCEEDRTGLWLEFYLLSVYLKFLKVKIASYLIQYILTSFLFLHSSQTPHDLPSLPDLFFICFLFRKEKASTRLQMNRTKQEKMRKCESPCDGLYILGPESSIIRRYGLVAVGVSLLGWRGLRPSSQLPGSQFFHKQPSDEDIDLSAPLAPCLLGCYHALALIIMD